MNISWYLGFGWIAIATVILCGVGINTLSAPLNWVLYVPFLIVAVYMTVRFRLFSTQRWRRVHARIIRDYGKFAEQEYDAAKKDGREYDIAVPCRMLADSLFGQQAPELAADLLGKGRTQYYRDLATACPAAFLEGVSQDRHEAVLAGVNEDIDASQLGPDILIARAIEVKYGRPEAVQYLKALLLGRVR